jgi:alcohol dehydrogenase (cytochrome c)
MTGSFDPDLNLIYWGVGNPAPEFQADVRIGDNLYSNSVIALDPDSGELKWHFQFTPQGEHDWDSNSVPVLVDTEFQGKPRKLLLMAVKNGFYYVLDRVTGEFLLAREIVKQTWAEKIDEQGRPIRRPNTSPSTKGTLVYPGSLGGANWWPPSYSPRTNLFYLPVLEMASIYFRSPVDLEEGREKGMVWFTGSAIQGVSGAPHYTAIRALVAGTDQLKWEFKLPPRMEIARIGGALSTAGDLVFFGDKDHFYALDARSGEELWRIRLGGEVNAAPMTYLSEGRQHLTIATGRSIFTFALPKH